MTPATAVEIVSRLFLATGRKPEPGTFAVWEEALDDLQDGPALEAAMQVIRTTDMTYGPPSPVLVRDAYQAIMRRRDSGRPALLEENDPVVADPEAARAAIADTLQILRRGQRVPAADQPGPIPDPPEAPRRGNTAHDFGDHSLCYPAACPEAPTADEPEPEGADA